MIDRHNTLLNILTDEELLSHFHAQHDPLTSTPIADELAKRFEELVELTNQYRNLVKEARDLSTKLNEHITTELE